MSKERPAPSQPVLPSGQALVLEEFQRLANSCPGRRHVVVWTTIDWSPEHMPLKIAMGVLDEFPCVEEVAWNAVVRDPFGILKLASEQERLRYAVHHHWIDISPWLRLDRPRLAEGGFYLEELPLDRGLARDADVNKFWELAKAAEKAFGLIPSEANWRNDPAGNAWLRALYDLLQPAVEEGPVRESGSGANFPSQDDVMNTDPELRERARVAARYRFRFRRLPIGVFQASVKLVEILNANKTLTVKAVQQGDRSGDDDQIGDEKTVLKKVGDGWTIEYGGESQQGIGHVKSFDDVHYLLLHQGERIQIEDLPQNKGSQVRAGDVDVATKEDGVDLLRQITRLQGEREQEDDVLVQRENDERIKALRKQFNQNFNNVAEPRCIVGDLNKMIGATKRRFERLILRLKPSVPVLAKHLEKHIIIDRECVYNPESHINWDLGD